MLIHHYQFYLFSFRTADPPGQLVICSFKPNQTQFHSCLFFFTYFYANYYNQTSKDNDTFNLVVGGHDCKASNYFFSSKPHLNV